MTNYSMPNFLEKTLRKEYGRNNPAVVYGTMNKIGAMRGNKITAKGKAMQKKHEAGESKVKEKKEEKRYSRLHK